MASLLAGDHRPQFGLEANDQANILLRSAHVVPGQEEVVGVAHLGLAVVGLHLIGTEHVLASRTRIGRFPGVFIEGIDHQIAFDLDRFFFAMLVEHDPASKPASRCFSLGIADRIDPNRQNSRGQMRIVVFGLEGIGKGLFYVELGTSARQACCQDRHDAPVADRVTKKLISHRSDSPWQQDASIAAG